MNNYIKMGIIGEGSFGKVRNSYNLARAFSGVFAVIKQLVNYNSASIAVTSRYIWHRYER